MTDPLALELRRLRDEVAELRDEQAHLLRALLARQDRRTGAALVPLLAERFDGDDFSAADLAAALPGLRITRPRIEGVRHRYYEGLRLRTPDDPEAEDDDEHEAL